jgi:hypothetical protein
MSYRRTAACAREHQDRLTGQDEMQSEQGGHKVREQS